jgi:hypothetical protein
MDRDLARFRLLFPQYADDPDDFVTSSWHFQWWVSGERMRDFGWLVIDAFRPLSRRFGIELKYPCDVCGRLGVHVYVGEAGDFTFCKAHWAEHQVHFGSPNGTR